ncbi:DUF2285 domain-containing protein [Rhizorhapis sp. SPR117]|uniref:DUF2285 domain-containing protein n=1 Tax=Rhizorhapis sp. SPR117 TaxID=2912611 RepID=UPI001F2203A4|nr:DUF2285 domain-containing protein [Rhizorhapis sp. SPR117]
MNQPAFLEVPPQGQVVTDYDLTHLRTYLRLLDASADETATWQEAIQIIFHVDPIRDRDRARRLYESHLARARWMSEAGYRQLAAFEQFCWKR